jgi:autoinducer-2 kinase
MATQAARARPGAEGVLAIGANAFDYTRWRHAAPALLNLPVADPPATRGLVFRALLENAALVTRANLETLTAAAGRPASVAFGGGGARSPLWAQLLADTLGREVRVPPVAEASALGAAILAGVGVGAFDDPAATAAALAAGGRTHLPDPAAVAAYDDCFDRWRRAYAHELALATEGVTTPLWRPPGQA